MNVRAPPLTLQQSEVRMVAVDPSSCTQTQEESHVWRRVRAESPGTGVAVTEAARARVRAAKRIMVGGCRWMVVVVDEDGEQEKV